MSPVPSLPTPSSPPVLVVNKDPAIPAAFEKPSRWRSVTAPIMVKGQDTVRVDVPREWTEKLRTRISPPEGRFRLFREYDLRVLSRPDMTSTARTRDARADQLRHNGTAGLQVISQDSGSVKSRIDDTIRRYEELFYSYVDVSDHNHRKFVRLRWLDGLELAVTGRERDVDALLTVLDRAAASAELVPGEDVRKPG